MSSTSKRPRASEAGSTKKRGGWEPLRTEWWDTDVVNCAFCGEMMPERQWVSNPGGGRRMVFHSPECEQLYLEYWVPKHGYTTPTKPRRGGLPG